MKDTLFLTWQYIKFNRRRLALVVALVTIAALLPLALDMFAAEALQHLRGETRSTPADPSSYGIQEDLKLLGNTLAMMVSVVGAASLVVILCVLTLSLSMRREEMEALTRLGCSPMRVGALLSFEFVLICLTGGLIALALLLLLGEVSADLVRYFLVR